MEADENFAEVVPLHPERDLTDDDAPVARVPGTPSYCGHQRIVLHTESHKVVCKQCDREVDPFAFLEYLAGNWEKYATHRKEQVRRAREAHERLEEILRLERNARARLKRLDPKAAKAAPEVPWGDSSA